MLQKEKLKIGDSVLLKIISLIIFSFYSVIFYTPDFIPLPVHPLTVPHTITPPLHL